MPLWVDLKGVPNNLYSHKGLKCLSKAVGTFVKLHPSTEKCVRLDMARALIEVNLHKPLVEKISFLKKVGVLQEVEVSFPWLPPRCNICRKWGQKGQECLSKEIQILQNKEGEVEPANFAAMPCAAEGTSSKKGTEKQVGNVIENLIKELEILSPTIAAREEVNMSSVSEGIKLSEPTSKAFHTDLSGEWENGT